MNWPLQSHSVLFIAAGCLMGTPAFAQDAKPVQLGMIGGKPVEWRPNRDSAVARFRAEALRPPNGPLDEQRVNALHEATKCDLVRTSIQVAANTDATRRLGVSVTKQEADDLHQQVLKSSAMVAIVQQTRETNLAIAEGLHQVYDLGMDPAETFRKLVGPRGVVEASWQMALELGRKPEGRARYVQGGATTLESVKSSTSDGEFNLLLRQRLDEAVDDEIARTDATFRKYLQDYRKTRVIVSPFERSANIGIEPKRYLDTARANWWKQRYAQVSVSLYDPNLARQCDVAALSR